MCGLCFIVAILAYVIGASKMTINREHQEWLADQREKRNHVTDNAHHEHERNFGGI